MQDLLSSIAQKKSRLDRYRPLSPNQIKNLKSAFDVLFTYNSNAIEGSTLTYSETKLILNEGITIGGKSINEHLETINHKEAIDFIEELASINTNDITLRDIKTIHHIILKGIDNQNAGVYRSRNVGVVKSDGEIHSFTQPLKIEEEMQEFIEWLKTQSIDEPILLASSAHLRFVSIHPFIDGNGRTARLLMNLILLQNGYPPAIIKVSERAEYIQAIERYQQGGEDAHIDFYRVVLKSVDVSLSLYLKIIEDEIEII